MYNLRGKVALVTGAAGAQGLGRAMALRLASEGADLVINDLHEESSPRKGLPSVVREIQALGRRALPVFADVSSTPDVKRMVDAALNEFGRIDILINNAAAPPGRDRVPLVDLEEAEFDRVQRVDVKGTFLCSQAVARAMIANGEGGRIINISSIASKKAILHYGVYCTSKFAVRGFTKVLALELAPHGITVNAICPGLVDTERLDDNVSVLAPPDMSADEYRRHKIERTIAGIPLGRLTEAGDIANMAAFLASEQAAFHTGMSFTVDGGYLME